MRQPFLQLSIVVFLSTLLGACSTYRVLVTQGNVVQTEKLEQLQLGMTPEQVEYLLGTPLLRSPVAENRWDYVYRTERGGALLYERRITVFFENGVVSNVEDTDPPAAKKAAAIESVDAEPDDNAES